jgi:drug/metabolite transporter (DMT)-like permease
MNKSGAWYILLATVCWSTSGLFVRMVPADALLMNAIRSVVALPMLLLYTKGKWRVGKTIILGALCISLTNNLYFLSLSLTTVGNAIVLQYTAPVFVLIATCLYAKKAPRPMQIVVLVLGVAGVASVFGADLLASPDTAAMLGNLCALASGITFAGVFFVNKLPGASPIDSTLTAFAINWIPGLFFLSQLPHIGGQGWLALAGLGIFQHGLAYIMFSRGIPRCSGFRASLIGMLEVLLAPLWVFLAFGEQLTPALFVGGGMILLAVLCNTLHEQTHATRT